MTDLTAATVASEILSRQYAEAVTRSNALLDLMRGHGMLDGSKPRRHRKSAYQYKEEKKILHRLNRCKTNKGKLLALSRILSDVRRDCSDY